MGFLEQLEELSRRQREEVGRVSRKYGFDGTPVGGFSDLLPKKRKPKRKPGRPKGGRLPIGERLRRHYED